MQRCTSAAARVNSCKRSSEAVPVPEALLQSRRCASCKLRGSSRRRCCCKSSSCCCRATNAVLARSRVLARCCHTAGHSRCRACRSGRRSHRLWVCDTHCLKKQLPTTTWHQAKTAKRHLAAPGAVVATKEAGRQGSSNSPQQAPQQAPNVAHAVPAALLPQRDTAALSLAAGSSRLPPAPPPSPTCGRLQLGLQLEPEQVAQSAALPASLRHPRSRGPIPAATAQLAVRLCRGELLVSIRRTTNLQLPRCAHHLRHLPPGAVAQPAEPCSFPLAAAPARPATARANRPGAEQPSPGLGRNGHHVMQA